MKKIKSNFLVVSNYYNDISWVPEYTDDYLVYDQSGDVTHPKTFNPPKVIKSPHLGHNIRDYCTYIIDHYDSLPDVVIFTAGNVFPRHVSEEYFQKVMNNAFFTPIEDYRMHKEKWPVGFFSADGGFCELNTSWYLNDSHPTKYFHNYNDFLRFCFVDPLIPRYNRFAPGANYIVPKANILKLPKIFYENLRIFVSHCETAIPGESHIIERALYTLWNCNFEIHNNMLKPFDRKPVSFSDIKTPSPISFHARIMRRMKYELNKLLKKIRLAKKQYSQKKHWMTTQEISEYRKKIKIYDAFNFFNELDLLEIRLNTLNDVVDYFVIVEANKTFSGNSTPLFYEENKERFKKWEHKIIHYVVRDMPDSMDELRKRLVEQNDMPDLDKEIIKNALTSDSIQPGAAHWLRDFFQKENIKKALIGLNDDDICFISDVDEIWNPKILIDFSKDDIFKLKQVVYAYYLNNRSSEPWAGTTVTKYKNLRHACLNHIRSAKKTEFTYLNNGGWHFTNQGGAEALKNKLEAYSHQEYNSEQVKSQIEKRIKENKDFIGRGFKLRIDEKGLPDFILNNKEKYKHLFK